MHFAFRQGGENGITKHLLGAPLDLLEELYYLRRVSLSDVEAKGMNCCAKGGICVDPEKTKVKREMRRRGKEERVPEPHGRQCSESWWEWIAFCFVFNSKARRYHQFPGV